MANRKIWFFIIVGILGLLLIYGIWNLSQKNTAKKNTATKTLSVWVVGDTSEQYDALFGGFGGYNATYKNTTIDVRVFPDYEKYQRILLSTLAESAGPDIFMVEGAGDEILRSKLIPIPDSYIPISDFEKRYEDIFLPLLTTEGSGKNIIKQLIGIPLGYETLGLFYHKSLVRSVPKTWSEIDAMTFPSEGLSIFPVNLGFGPRYTPDATDIIAYFIGKNGAESTKSIQSSGLDEYLSYGNTTVKKEDTGDNENQGINDTLIGLKGVMDSENLSTIDLFIRGRIAMIIGFPSLIRELEKADKRAGADALGGLILTDRLPSESLGKTKTNLARYKYLGISKKSENPEAAASLIAYLMSDIGSEKTREAFPLLISPIREQVESQKNTPLSQVFARTRLDAFIPDLQEKVFVFDYGIKGEYERIFGEYLDRTDKFDNNTIIKKIQSTISCEINALSGGSVTSDCAGENE